MHPARSFPPTPAQSRVLSSVVGVRSEARSRCAQPSDVGTIARLLALAVPDCIALPETRITSSLSEFHVAHCGRGRTMGCAALRMAEDGSACIGSVAVHPLARGRGVGSFLIADLLSALPATVRSVRCTTRRPEFYARFGFSVTTMLPEEIALSSEYLARARGAPPRVSMLLHLPQSLKPRAIVSIAPLAHQETP